MHFIDKVFPRWDKKIFFTALGGLALVSAVLLIPAVLKFVLSGLKRIDFPGTTEPGWARFIFANILFLVQVFFFFLHPACSTLGKWSRCVGGFLLLYLLSCLLSPWLTGQYSNSMFQEILKLLTTSSLFFIFFYFSYRGLSDFSRNFWAFFGCVLISGEALLGLYQYMAQGDMGLQWLGEKHLECVHPFALIPLEGGRLWFFDPGMALGTNSIRMLRAYGTFDHPNLFGGVLIAGILLTCHLLLHHTHAKKMRLGLTLGLTIQGLALVATFSRSAWLGVTVGVVVMLIYRWMRQSGHIIDKCVGLWREDRALLKAICISVCTTLFVFHNQIWQRSSFQENVNSEISVCKDIGQIAAQVASGTPVQAQVEGDKKTGLNFEIKLDYERQQYLKMAGAMIERYPLQGVGFHKFINHIHEFSGKLVQQVNLFPVHNIYILVAAEVGVPAAVFFIGFITLVGWHALRNRGREALFAIWLGFVVAGFFDNYFLTSQMGRVLLFVIAGLICLDADSKRSVLEKKAILG